MRYKLLQREQERFGLPRLCIATRFEEENAPQRHLAIPVAALRSLQDAFPSLPAPINALNNRHFCERKAQITVFFREAHLPCKTRPGAHPCTVESFAFPRIQRKIASA